MANGKRTIRSKGAGSWMWRYGHRMVRVSLPDKTRPWYRLCKAPDGPCTCHEMSDKMADEHAAGISERERDRVAAELAELEAARQAKRLTVKEFGVRWTSGELYKLHGEVKRLREKKASADDDKYRLTRYVYPVIGDKPVDVVTEQDVERVMAEIETRRPKHRKSKLRQGTRAQVYQCLRRLFDLAVRPGRLREDSPVRDYLKPGKDKPKLFAYLYPSELVALVGCKTIPVGRRVFYALAVYTGLRKGSLYALTWAGVDFEHGTLTSLHSKTGLPQLFELQAGIVELLALWFERQGRPKSGENVVRAADVDVPLDREAEVLRDDLRAAGIARAVLLERADNVEPMRFHDLRATFVTWAMRQGRGDGWISDRTGHLTAEMRARYARAARTLADLKYEPFPDVSKGIPELLEQRDNVVSILAARRGGAPA